MKTLIELFDECQLENIIAGLSFVPEKIIFVGFNNVMTKKRTEDMECLFASKGVKIEFSYEFVGRYNYDEVENRLFDILMGNEDCVFDITGGSDVVLAAMGAVAFKNNIPMIRFDIKSGKFVRVKNCDEIAEPKKPTLSFEETVLLNGGAVVNKSDDDFEWDLTEDFKEDIEKIWDICRADCAEWNKQANILGAFEQQNEFDKSLVVKANRKRISVNRQFMDKLTKAQLIYDYTESGEWLSFRYKNDAVRRTLIKAGNVLELYTYMLLGEVTEEEPSFYDDILTGVVVDWDGVVYREYRRPADTQNELDIVVMRDVVPIFVSCKNGEVHKEALYELDTVADKFGGKYAKKVLVSTYVTFNEKGKKHLETRAKDMKIELVHGVHKLSKEEFKVLLKNRLR